MLQYLQSPLFNLAEGSYPFPSDYITFALTSTHDPLPAWPMKEMCDPIGEDYGVTISGSTSDVEFSISNDNVRVSVNWDQTNNNGYTINDLASNKNIGKLLNSVTTGIQIWYNVSGTMPSCINWDQTAPNAKKVRSTAPKWAKSLLHQDKPMAAEQSSTDANSNICTWDAADFTADMGWYALTCNEGKSLVIYNLF